MMLPAICLLICAFGGVFASPIANNYVDNLLSYTLKNQLRIHNLEPAPLPDFRTDFKDKAVFVTVKGTANYTQGKLIGLSNVTRYSECMGPSFSFGGRKINCTIGFNHLQSHFSGKIKYGKLPQASFKGNGNITTTILFVEFSSQPGSNFGRVTNLHYQLYGEVQPKFTGLGSALNKYLKVLYDDYKRVVKGQFMNLITNNFQYALNMAAAQIPMPT